MSLYLSFNKTKLQIFPTQANRTTPTHLSANQQRSGPPNLRFKIPLGFNKIYRHLWVYSRLNPRNRKTIRKAIRKAIRKMTCKTIRKAIWLTTGPGDGRR